METWLPVQMTHSDSENVVAETLEVVEVEAPAAGVQKVVHTPVVVDKTPTGEDMGSYYATVVLKEENGTRGDTLPPEQDLCDMQELDDGKYASQKAVVGTLTAMDKEMAEKVVQDILQAV